MPSNNRSLMRFFAYFEWTDEEKERETQHLEQLIAESDLRDLKGEK